MNKAQKHVATWQGKEHELSLSGWARLTDKSRTFLSKCIDRADIQGIPADRQMQWAIEQTPCDPKISGSRRRAINSCYPIGKEVRRKRKEEANEAKINCLLRSFGVKTTGPVLR